MHLIFKWLHKRYVAVTFWKGEVLLDVYICLSQTPQYFAAAQHSRGSVVKYLLNISNLTAYMPGAQMRHTCTLSRI